jgi:hypothetical protein
MRQLFNTGHRDYSCDVSDVSKSLSVISVTNSSRKRLARNGDMVYINASPFFDDVNNHKLYQNKHKRTIPTERSRLVDEASANFS